ncbi:MAG: hypothetical protein K5985_11035 [Lachnospiraceae bacterium]|nr:hypothetical protein [Lachnospiraceae bacterium]
MEASVFGCRLDLLVRLYDTTTGAAVNENAIIFRKNDQIIRPEMRGIGTYVFINTGRENFLMHIKVNGFEEYETEVDYETLDSHLPALDVFLMPSENTFDGERFFSFSGTLPFLEAIEAVNLSRPVCMANSYDLKKNELSFFGVNGGRVRMDSVWYGLLRADKTGYEKLEVKANVTPSSVKLGNPLKEEVTSNLPVMRILIGRVGEDGTYLLRARNDGGGQVYLVRFIVDGREMFQTVDMNAPEQLHVCEAQAETVIENDDALAAEGSKV